MGEFEKRKINIILGLEEPKTIMEFLYAFPSIPPMIPVNLELLQERVNEQSEWERKFRKKIEEAKQEFPNLSEMYKLRKGKQTDEQIISIFSSFCIGWYEKWIK